MGRVRLDQAEERNMNWWFMVQWVEIVVITKMAAYTVGKDRTVLGRTYR